VQAAFVPNIITPNADQKNDTFAPRIGGCTGRLQVFSRWGKMVYDRRDYNDEWAGDGLPDGPYYYLLTAPDGSITAKGWVEVTR
jgi:gliding motility-associated-like protein